MPRKMHFDYVHFAYRGGGGGLRSSAVTQSWPLGSQTLRTKLIATKKLSDLEQIPACGLRFFTWSVEPRLVDQEGLS